MIKLIPLGKLEIDWDTYLIVAKQALNRSITTTLDSKSMDVRTSSGYLVTLAELKEGNQNIVDVLMNPGNTLDHLFYSFIVISDRDLPCELLEITPLNVTRTACKNGLSLSIVSGNLTQWRSAIINGCTDTVSYNLRLLLDEILIYFEQEGLKKLWSKYTKAKMSDGTIKLIEKS
jgi:hypothetical protein